MRELIKYSLNDYMRSHKYFPPLSAFIILLFVFYSYKPNIILDSYAVTALLIYVISAWISMSVLSLDPPIQRQLMIIHIGGSKLYYLGKLMVIGLITILLIIYAFLYPIVFDMFQEPVTFKLGVISLLNHIILSLLGISVGSLFSKVLMKNTVNSYGGVALAITLSFTMLGLYEVLPGVIKNIVWVIPPVLITQKQLFNWNGETVSDLNLLPFTWITVYAVALIFIFLKLVSRKS